MKLKFQFAALLLAAVFMQPILADNVQAPAPAGIEQTAAPTVPDEQKGKESTKTSDAKKFSKERRAQEVDKRLREIFVKGIDKRKAF